MRPLTHPIPYVWWQSNVGRACRLSSRWAERAQVWAWSSRLNLATARWCFFCWIVATCNLQATMSKMSFTVSRKHTISLKIVDNSIQTQLCLQSRMHTSPDMRPVLAQVKFSAQGQIGAALDLGSLQLWMYTAGRHNFICYFPFLGHPVDIIYYISGYNLQHINWYSVARITLLH